MSYKLTRPWGRKSKLETKMSTDLIDPDNITESAETPRRVNPKMEIKMPLAQVSAIDRVMRSIVTDRRDELREIVAASYAGKEIDFNFVAEMLLDEGRPASYFETLLTQYGKAFEAQQVASQIEQAQADAAAALITIRDVTPRLKPLSDALDIARQAVSEPPTTEQLSAVRKAEAQWGPVADEYRIASGKRTAAINRVNSLQLREEKIRVRKDPDSRLSSPLNFAFPE